LSVNAAVKNQEAMKRAGVATLLRKEAAFEQLHNAFARRQRTRKLGNTPLFSDYEKSGVSRFI
jgi:hypothetical protein